MSEISATELFCIVLSGLVFFIVFKIIETNWEEKFSEIERPMEEIIEEKKIFSPRLVVLRKEEMEEVMAGKMETGDKIPIESQIKFQDSEQEPVLVSKYP